MFRGNDDSNGGCNLNRTTQFDPNSSPYPPRTHGLPARFVQLTAAEATAPVAFIAPNAAPAEVSARLERIESSLKQAAQRQSGLESVFDKEIESLRTAARIPSRQSLVNVRVDYPPFPVERKKEKRHSGKKHSVLNQMKVRSRECWRNVRDRLPGN
jgi:hypothetical protein